MVFKYYILNRPVSIGTQPSRGLINFVNYNQRTFIGEIGREAWGMQGKCWRRMEEKTVL